MKRRGPKNKLQRGIRELLIGCVIGCAVGISFDLILLSISRMMVLAALALIVPDFWQ